MKRWRRALCVAACAAGLPWACPAASAGVSAVDDGGHTVALAAPAQRVVSLAPHLTELAYAAGGGAAMVGAMRYSDHPAAARALPVVGDAHAIDFERIVQLRPDLVLVWSSGLNERHKARLRSLGLTVYESEIRRAQGIPDTLRRLGALLGHAATAETAARQFEGRWQALAAQYRQRPAVRVFWQLWHEPLMTVNREHLISEAMHTCGGVNVFGDLPLLTPTVSWEAAVAADPQLIATSGPPQDAVRDRALWQRFGGVSAVRRGQWARIDGDLVGRMGPRFVEGAERLCRAIDAAR
ncbi:MAG TPA: cobalamin-binding protein [Burkholderiaceae bacterium]|nr:cobalamin-binding protein [Burkholderiaceae bacterium]